MEEDWHWKKKQIKTSPCEHKTSPKEKKEIFFLEKSKQCVGRNTRQINKRKRTKKKKTTDRISLLVSERTSILTK